MTDDELKGHSLFFQAGYTAGYNNKFPRAPWRSSPKATDEETSDYWWGFHTGKGDHAIETLKRLT